jgi:anthranilate phosphoribosyltransferase
MSSVPAEEDAKVSITSLLKRLWHESPTTKPTADEIAGALSLIFTNSLSEVQTGALLTCLHFTDQDRQAEVLAKCSKAMRDFSTKIEVQELEKLLQERGRKEGNYHGGFVSFLSLQRAWSSTIHSEGLKYRSLALTLYSVT